MKSTKSRKKIKQSLHHAEIFNITTVKDPLIKRVEENNKAHPHAPRLPQNQLTTTNRFLANVPFSWG
jgi:hypothetical protein